MKKSIKIALAVYIIAMLGCVFAFVMQKSVTYEHINFAHEKMMASMGTNPDTAQSVEYNRYLAEASVAMGHEIEEHLLSLLIANLAIGIFLVFCILSHKNDNESIQGTS